MKARGPVALLALTLAFAAAAASAAGIELQEAWMRPATAGQASAAVFLDIRSEAAVRLVGARSPAAEAVEIVRNDQAGDPAADRTVPELPVPARAIARLAYRGNHLRLVNVRKTVLAGDRVPIELRFMGEEGATTEVATQVLVRGVLPRPAPGVEPVTIPGAPPS